ncbi:regulator of G protein-like protein [Xylogone sp. PMI_703]|nr:regulator of G protein-like protein [Xylogone sp. PMI_703]
MASTHSTSLASPSSSQPSSNTSLLAHPAAPEHPTSTAVAPARSPEINTSEAVDCSPDITTSNTTTTTTAASSSFHGINPASTSSSTSSPSPSSPSFHDHNRSSTGTGTSSSTSTTSTSNFKHRQSTPSISSPSNKSNRSGFFSFGSLAREKAATAIASLEPSIRTRSSSNSLYHAASASIASATASLPPPPPPAHLSTSNFPSYRSPDSEATPRDLYEQARAASGNLAALTAVASRQSLLETDPPSQPYTDTAADQPAPVIVNPLISKHKMHQTSSRLLRMTSDERPFTRDFKDLFSTLVVSLPLAAHRVRLSRVDHSFLSEEAINNLGSLKFSQSNRMPDPKDPSRIVTTTTTTTFSMAREMARSVCQRFLDARFIESADGKQAKEFTMKGMVWQLTPKGIHILDRFCSRNGIQQRHVTELINSPRNTMQLVILERDPATDKLSSDRSTIEVIFRRFIGQNGPNVKSSTNSADSDSLNEYKDGIAGVKMASERKVGSPPRTFYQTFTGKSATDWLMDCCTTVERRETQEIASLFLEYELIWCVQPDRAFAAQDKDAKFHPTKHAIYQMTQKGKDVINMTNAQRTSESEVTTGTSTRPGVSRDSNTQKLDKILNDAALRLLFRENLRDTHCEENLSFYLDVDEFLKSCKAAIKTATANAAKNGNGNGNGKPTANLDLVKETMASAYGIYNAFLAPGSPCELNIDHMLRNQLATRMTKAVGQDTAMIDSLREVTKLFEEAQISVFKLMASDSVPKFMKSSKYEQTLKNYDFDAITPGAQSRYQTGSGGLDRTMSKSNRS